MAYERAAPPSPAAAVPGALDRLGAALRAAAPALLAYAAVRATGLLVMSVWMAFAEESPRRFLNRRWDSLWYARIAEDGYGYTRFSAGRWHPDEAFFPLFPVLERAVTAVVPVSANGAGLLVGWTAALAAAWGIFAVATLLYRRMVGVVLVALWAAVPPAFVQSMAYTETLFTALAAWALFAVLTGRWWWAGALAVAAGLTRPSGVAVVAAVLVGGAVELLLRRSGAPRRRVLAAMAIAPLGWLGYVGYVSWRRSSPTGYFDVQAEWGNGFDGGVAFLRFVTGMLGTNPAHGLLILAALAALAALLVQCVRQRQPLPLLAYTAVLAVTALVGAGYFTSRPRLLMPAFALLLPLAVWLAGKPRAATAGAVAAAAVSSGVYGTWFLLYEGPP
ncbi:hypothetical protein [Streptomyces hainanensis]|uniref:Glycosyltransferase RgtA/B/C/D-like domain-containing protein n=1 Tax=Streptomyces hainanensis TaxID=402648 RepID=A0A4R4TCP6_9ACTN|nr:hypothetical protein [Streptomyces hainanensis]TDC75221.1 hypothetical protein E1283_13115 [Streptomyces hainanensis]